MPKDARKTLILILLATFFFGTAVWQARVAQVASLRPHVLGPPTKTRHALRPPPAPFSGDPAEDYRSRCLQGLTDLQIQWITDDFQNTGIDADLTPDSPAALIAQRQAQQHWYRDALADGLRLGPAQIQQVDARLHELLAPVIQEFLRQEQDKRPLIRLSAKSNVSNKAYNSRIPLTTPLLWLGADETASFQPAKLCTLTPEQAGILHPTLADFNPKDRSSENSGLLLPLSLPKFYQEDPLLDLQFPAAYALFPQVGPTPLAASPDNILPVLRSLHPAQLKMMLLMDPFMARRIQLALQSKASLSSTAPVPIPKE